MSRAPGPHRQPSPGRAPMASCTNTWPSVAETATTKAAIQLRLDAKGRTYSSLVVASVVAAAVANPRTPPPIEPTDGAAHAPATSSLFELATAATEATAGSRKQEVIPLRALLQAPSVPCRIALGGLGGSGGQRGTSAYSSNNNNSNNNPNNNIIHAASTGSPCDEHRCISGQAAAKASTLRRHYYPEGAWGWLVLAVGTLQAILNHGVQLSGPLYLLPAGERFHQPAVNSC
uniref:Uncharacterized protein n=1 Tax=Anopheles atroparvus TaxID=41427 RepID=A0AAG5DL85_ANOAO